MGILGAATTSLFLEPLREMSAGVLKDRISCVPSEERTFIVLSPLSHTTM